MLAAIIINYVAPVNQKFRYIAICNQSKTIVQTMKISLKLSKYAHSVVTAGYKVVS